MVFVGYNVGMIGFEFHLITPAGLSLREACIIVFLAQSKCDEATVIARSVHYLFKEQSCATKQSQFREAGCQFFFDLALYMRLLRFARNDSSRKMIPFDCHCEKRALFPS